MTTFEERQASFERRFTLDADLRFRATARRNKLLGRWAAEKLGLSGEAAEEYARSVVAADFDRPGEEDVFEKVQSDLKTAASPVSDAEIRRAMDQLMAEAKTQISSETQG